MMEAWKRKPLADYFSIEDRQLAVLQKIFPDIGRRVTQMSARPIYSSWTNNQNHVRDSGPKLTPDLGRLAINSLLKAKST